MTRKHWVELGPSLVAAAGIVISTLLAVSTASHGALALSGPFLLALGVVGADALRARLAGMSSGAFPAALLLGSAILLAGLMLTLRDPNRVKTFIPIIGAAGWVSLLPRHASRRTTCARI